MATSAAEEDSDGLQAGQAPKASPAQSATVPRRRLSLSVITAQILRVCARPDAGMQTIYGVGVLIVLFHLIAAGVVAALISVRQPPP